MAQVPSQGDARRRRRTTAAIVAAVALVAGTPIGLALAVGDEPRTAPDVATEVPSPTPTARERTVSFRDVTVQVPGEWSHGCPGGPQEFAVWIDAALPSSTVPCDRQATYGIEFYSADEIDRYGWDANPRAMLSTTGERPEGAWTAGVISNLGTAIVTTPTREDTQRILDAMDVLDGATPDRNGCPIMRGDAEASQGNDIQPTSVCRYDAEDRLEFSARLDLAEAEALWAAIDRAPIPEMIVDCPSDGASWTVLLRADGYVGTITTGATCDGYNRIHLSGVEREVTDEIRALIGVQR